MRKNSEKRKEKSRKAARERRSQESKIFDQIEGLIPVYNKAINHLDKASLIRLAINYLKVKQLIEPINKCVSSLKPESELIIEENASTKALNGFLLVLSKEGDMVYISDNVDQYLGLTQIDLIGQSIYDYTHPCDHNEIKDVLALKNVRQSDDHKEMDNKNNRIFNSILVRMKCTLTSKGRNLNLKSAYYKVIHCSGHIKIVSNKEKTSDHSELVSQTANYFMINICEPIEQPMSVDLPLSSHMFISRHSLDMKYTDVDESIHTIVGYNSKELTGKSLFNFFHALDLQQLEKFFKTLFAKGQSLSNYYRFLAKSGGYLWLLTQATVTTDSHSSQPQSVICINHVISGIVNESEIVSEEQCIDERREKDRQVAPVVKRIVQLETSTRNPAPIPLPAPVPAPTPSPVSVPFVSSTKTVFAPKTADMDNGFIVFDNANHMTYLPDPEDLTHLAPEAAGDDYCVPFPGLLAEFNELNFFDEVFLNNNDTNANLFSDEDKVKLNDDCLNHLNDINIYNSNVNDLSEPFVTKANDNSLYKTVTQQFIKSYPNYRDNVSADDSPLPNDPLLSYHEELYSNSQSTDSSDPYSSDTNSPLNSSPVLSQTSNFFYKSPTEKVSKMSLNDKNDLLDDKVLEMRAPYIPIDEDFPLALDGDLQLNYSTATMDDFNAFDNICGDKPFATFDAINKPLVTIDSPLPPKAHCLEALLQKDCKQQKRGRSNSKRDKQKSTTDNLKLIKAKSNITTNKGQSYVDNNINNINLTAKQQFVMNANNLSQRNLFKQTDNDLIKLTISSSKRPYVNETNDILYNTSITEVNPNDRNLKKQTNEMIQNNKKFKINNPINAMNNTNYELNKANSVLMNLLVNGEDLTNGYSKYSNIDRNRGQKLLTDFNANNIINKLSNSKTHPNHPIVNGLGLR
ncbi:hypoxia-inducible factor 1-alpha-like [Oppia nitens]|uniref:hypoxia-inducible factor 1-alpha-like n=1 Tax=Oppia nitens TaxID=1686743 RepID=UPI0023DB965F|nr:hypoxia-inducible factor 1-alpha-like [Oppia nitens]